MTLYSARLAALQAVARDGSYHDVFTATAPTTVVKRVHLTIGGAGTAQLGVQYLGAGTTFLLQAFTGPGAGLQQSQSYDERLVLAAGDKLRCQGQAALIVLTCGADGYVFST